MPTSLLVALVSGVLALAVAAALTPVVRALALAVGAVDAPGERRVHTRVIPRMGGVAIGIAFAIAFGVAVKSGVLVLSPLSVPGVTGFAVGALIIFIAGIYDDLRGLGAKRKLVAQLVAATCAWFGGARIYEVVNLPGLGGVEIGPIVGYLATILWILAFTNAINLIDGLDGLAGGVVFFAALTNIVVAIITGNNLAVGLNAALAGAVLGFLFYNFNPAKIFMGDTGSLFLGYALSAGALLSSRQKESTLASLLVPIIALGVPLTDTILAMLRRVVERRSIFSADRRHLHHKLLELGLTHKRAVLVLYGCSIALSAIAIAAAFGQDWQVGGAILAAVLVLFGIIRFARYFEGIIVRTLEGRHEFSEAAASLKRAVPQLIRDLGNASNQASALAALEVAFDSTYFPRLALFGPGEESPLWQRSAIGSSSRREGTIREMSISLTLYPGGAPASLRVDCESQGANTPVDVEVLGALVGDVLQSTLHRIHAQTPSAMMRLIGEP